MMNKNIKILYFLKTLRESFPDCVKVYTEGGCYKLFLIIKSIFPEAICWYDIVDGHIYTEIDGQFYDIRGKHYQNVRWIRLEDEPNILKQVNTWGYERNN